MKQRSDTANTSEASEFRHCPKNWNCVDLCLSDVLKRLLRFRLPLRTCALLVAPCCPTTVAEAQTAIGVSAVVEESGRHLGKENIQLVETLFPFRNMDPKIENPSAPVVGVGVSWRWAICWWEESSQSDVKLGSPMLWMASFVQALLETCYVPCLHF